MAKVGNNGRTPPWLRQQLHEVFRCTFDLAADADNTVCELYFTEEDNALGLPWPRDQICYCNPPYNKPGQKIAKWLDKAYEEINQPGGPREIHFIIPASTCTRWFAKHMQHTAIDFMVPRVKFEDPNGVLQKSPKHPTMLMTFTRNPYLMGSVNVWEWSNVALKYEAETKKGAKENV